MGNINFVRIANENDNATSKVMIVRGEQFLSKEQPKEQAEPVRSTQSWQTILTKLIDEVRDIIEVVNSKGLYQDIKLQRLYKKQIKIATGRQQSYPVKEEALKTIIKACKEAIDKENTKKLQQTLNLV